MSYFGCERCNIYYEVKGIEQIREFNTCDCGNGLRYYDKVDGHVKTPPSNYIDNENGKKFNSFIDKLIRNYESTISKIVLCCVQELPFPLSTKRTILILKGSKSSFILRYNLNNLKTYSLLYNFTENQLNTIIGSLIHEGFLEIEFISKYKRKPLLKATEEGTPSLKVTEKGKKIINGDYSLYLGFLEGFMEREVALVDKKLYQHLRISRNNIARKKNISPYRICNNSTLIELSRIRPTNMKDLLSIHGIGEEFLQNYGIKFIQSIRDYKGEQ